MSGFISCDDTTLRPTPWELLPQLPAVGGFMFPEPWNTPAARITNNEQGAVLEPVGYSYWRNLNAHRNDDSILAMLSLGGSPHIFSINKQDGSSRLIRKLNIAHTGEGLYFSAHVRDIMYGAIERFFGRFNVEDGSSSVIFAVDSDKYLWQCHSNFDETIHSATLRDKSSYEMLGAVVHNENTVITKFYPRKGNFDECQIDKSGEFLVIKETYDDKRGESNRIIKLDDDSEQIISNADGALGHSDAGYGYMVGENDMSDLPNCVREIELNSIKYHTQYHGTRWSTGVGHISHTNVHNPGFVVISNTSRQTDVPRQNEIILVPLDRSQRFMPLAPSAVDLDAGNDDYRNMPKGNLCPYGEYFIWTANHRSNHLDAFILKVPQL